MLVLQKGKHLNVYHIGTTDEIPIKNIARELGHYFRRAVSIVPGEPTKGATLKRCPDIGKLRKLGYDPKVPLKEGLLLTAKWYDENADKKFLNKIKEHQ
jgi:nucleoside-diphosphate-sugar epimerase